MATMIPENVKEFTTEGERQTYLFLEKVAKPDNRFICWYLPDLQDREPDFILFSWQDGIVILEVKDWNLDQIREASPHSFILNIGVKSGPRQNPLKQARDYVYAMIDKLKADGRMISKNPNHYGNPKIPINYGVVFPKINKYEYSQKGFDQIIPPEKVFFWDDLHSSSDICSDDSGRYFTKAMEVKFPAKFKFTLKDSEIDHLKQLIFPMVRVEIPKRDCEMPYEERISRVKSLDQNQESLARKYEGGHRIITGPSGSGKTLILVHKAAFLLRYNSQIQSILFVCFNITLVNYIRRLLSEKGVPFGSKGVQIKPFYVLCAEIVGEPVENENPESGYYELVVNEALEKIETCGIQFDAVLIDEGQDFSDNMFKVLTALLNPATNNLTVAMDENQNLYQKRSSWKNLGVSARGRVHRIDYIYRNTIEISNFAKRFIGRSHNKDDDDPQMSLFPDFFDFHGPQPVLKRLTDLDSVISYTADEISRIARSEGCPYSEIAVLYVTQKPVSDGAPLPERLENTFADRGIMSKWASANYRSKRAYDITTDSVTISTIHSAKGMDYSCVFLLGLDYLKSKDERWTDEQIKKLAYVGVTRARYYLYMPFVDETALIGRLKTCMAQK